MDAERDALQKQIDDLAERVSLNQEMLAELQADGLINAEHAQQLELALVSSRTIGAALGIIMGRLDLDLEQAFQTLRRISQDRNVKVRDLAEQIVAARSIDVVTQGSRGTRGTPSARGARSSQSEPTTPILEPPTDTSH